MVLVTTSCTVLQTSIHSSSGILSTRFNALNWLVTCYFQCVIINDLISVIPEWCNVFPYFLQFMLEFCNKELMIWVTVSSRSCFCWLWSFSIFGCKEYNQSDFSIDHLVISRYRVVSCLVGSGHLLWPVSSLGKILLTFALLHSVLQGQTWLLLQVSLDFLLLYSNNLWWKGIFFFFFWCSRRSCRSS